MDLCAYPPTLGEHTGVALMGGRDIQMEAVRQAVSPHLRSDLATCVACGSVVGSSDVARSMTEADHVLEYCRRCDRLFKEETGMYFSDYVCHKRISRAKRLLETTALSVGDIGSQVGIYDVSCFTQCFKKQIGLSLMKYKQQFRQKSEKS